DKREHSTGYRLNNRAQTCPIPSAIYRDAQSPEQHPGRAPCPCRAEHAAFAAQTGLSAEKPHWGFSGFATAEHLNAGHFSGSLLARQKRTIHRLSPWQQGINLPHPVRNLSGCILYAASIFRPVCLAYLRRPFFACSAGRCLRFAPRRGGTNNPTYVPKRKKSSFFPNFRGQFL
ncbi:MAG: hypothetical protein ACI4JC_10935, partial [Faecalibacterium sp.]